MNFHFSFRGLGHSIDIQKQPSGYLAITDEGQNPVEINENTDGHISFIVNNREQRAQVIRDGQEYWIFLQGRTYHLSRHLSKASSGNVSAAGEQILRAPMPGQVRQLAVKQGDQVQAGDLLIVLEAMKMELRIEASMSGKIARMPIVKGDSVEKDQILVELIAKDTS